MRKTKPLTKAQYQENFAKIFNVVAQLIVAAFLVAVIIYSIFWEFIFYSSPLVQDSLAIFPV